MGVITRKRDNRDFGVFGAVFGGTASGRGVYGLETETRRRDKPVVATRCGNLGFNEKSRGLVPRLFALTPGWAGSSRSRVQLSGPDWKLRLPGCRVDRFPLR